MKKSEKVPRQVRPTGTLIVRLDVIKSRHEHLFFEEVSRRAATELRSLNLPAGSTIELWRGGQKIADAKVEIEGNSGHGGDLFEVFCSKSSELVVPEARLMRSNYLPIKGRNYAHEIKARNLMIDDEIVLTLSCQSLIPPSRESWSLDRWFRNATKPSKRTAYEDLVTDNVWVVIHRLFADKYPDDLDTHYTRFSEANQRTSWREALRLAIETVGIKTVKMRKKPRAKR